LGGKIVVFSTPLREERREMLATLVKKNPALTVDLERLMSLTVGMDYTAMRSFIEAAGVYAAIEKSECITEHHVIKAYQDKENGLPVIGHDVAKFDQLVGAYHEAGHAVVSHFHPFGKELDHISIGEREHTSGETVAQAGDFARVFYAELMAEIAISLAGHVTERIVVPQEWRTRQCRSDLIRANEVATKMVCWWGLGEGTGVRVYLSTDEKPRTDDPLVESAIKKILAEAENEAEKIVRHHIEKIKLLAQALVNGSGILGAEEIKKILGPRPKRPAPPSLYRI
jgi:ATP-dependent Zn protease